MLFTTVFTAKQRLKKARRSHTGFAAAMAAVVVGLTTLAGATAPASAGPLPAERAPGTAEEAVEHALSRVGKPYRYGAEGPDAFDCSGLVQWSFRKAGVRLPRTTYDQYDVGTRVSYGNLRRGDVVFFYSGPGHAGIYLGGGRMVHAPNSGGRVEVVRMSGHYRGHFAGAVRVT
ncbi:C40 family peptidase [Allonocardiopsis opalescens]|uniref:Cell wall-associated NlpC family hydrolase n=1 Tax=Allonocardiopsis opalescens TaxID=1144618 RepID=A0A2T0QAG2_9ACTN|nr:C40 family peptidase [Allonocardiopsis opalescens]PRY00802.1 cell wall-associated NlpC family hydrolase [Allonocardiopsis opalescens]